MEKLLQSPALILEMKSALKMILADFQRRSAELIDGKIVPNKKKKKTAQMF